MVETGLNPRNDVIEAHWVKYMAQVPDLRRRCKEVLQCIPIDIEDLMNLRWELEIVLEMCKTSIGVLRERLRSFDSKSGDPRLMTFIHAQRVNTLALADTTAIVLACMLNFLPLENVDLELQLAKWSLEIYEMAQIAVRYRPMGGMVMCICLPIARVGAADPEKRDAIKALYTSYQTSFFGQQGEEDVTEELQSIEKRYRLLDI